MADPGGISDPAADLQGLFASLRSNSSGKNFAASKDASPGISLNRKSYPFDLAGSLSSAQPLLESSPSAISPSNGPQSRVVPFNLNSSRSATPAAANDRSNVDRTTNLLNLLKFSTPNTPPTHPQQHSGVTGVAGVTEGNPQALASIHSLHSRGISASDLVASSMGKSSTPTPRENPSSSDHQDFLLKLLNRTDPSQSAALEQGAPEALGPRDGQVTALDTNRDLPETASKNQPLSVVSDKNLAPSAGKDSPIRVFGSSDDRKLTPFEAPDLTKAQPEPKKVQVFTYINPFEQLAATAPHTTPVSVNGDSNKRKIIEPSQNSLETASRKKLTSSSSPTQNLENALREVRQRLDNGPGAGRPSKFLPVPNSVDGQAAMEVKTEIFKAEENEGDGMIKQEKNEHAQEATVDSPSQDKAGENFPEVKLELDKEDNKGIPEEQLEYLPRAFTELGKGPVDELMKADVAHSWGGSHGQSPETTIDTDRVLQVFLFPMRPFIVIDIKSEEAPKLNFPESTITNIARLKKEYEPIDRTLATGTNDFIVYGIPRSGGLRVIRQDDGEASHIFEKAHDRIFNVSISVANPSSAFYGTQNIIATGISGTVYWAPILKPAAETPDGRLEDQYMVFPPPMIQPDASVGSQLKTRAKRSSRNPEFFAIGRGKSINIIFPAHARESKFLSDQSVMDTEKYFKDRSLKITLKKSSKDFTFSEDDSTLLTLDKSGKFSFWDIRDLVDMENASSSILAPVEAKGPLISFLTARPNEKCWPTSVLLVDKPRAYTRGIAQRYVIVGTRLNHTLQLWDLCLGKAVQEVNFAHEKESDPMCSVSYHAPTGMVVVGHPTLNMIYLLHLSAPKYNLPPISQAKFVQRLANKDSALPRPDATAILSGMREYSFSDKGQIRSVDLVSSPPEPNRLSEDHSRLNDENQDPVLFELYIMHSKGVTSVAIRKEELGWTKHNKVIHSINAEQEGFVLVKDLKLHQLNYPSEPSSVNGDSQAIEASTSITTSKFIAMNPVRTSATMPAKRDAQAENSVAPTVVANLNPIIEKGYERKKKREGTGVNPTSRAVDITSASSPEPLANTSPEAPSFQPASGVVSAPITPIMIVPSDVKGLKPSGDRHSERSSGHGEPGHLDRNESSAPSDIPGDLLEREFKKFESNVSEELKKVLNVQLGSLYQRFNEDRRVLDATSSAKQDAILRLISSTLGENVERSLSGMILSNIHKFVVPAITETTSSIFEKIISEALAQQLQLAIPPLLKLALPEAIGRGVQNPEVLRVITEQLTTRLSSQVENEFTTTLHNAIIPTFKTLAVNVAQRSGADTENRVHEYLRRAESQHREDSGKIEQLTNLVRGLSETVHMMASAQSEFQQKILKLQQQAAQDRQSGPDVVSPTQGNMQPGSTEGALVIIKSPAQEELEIITDLMTDGRYEEGTIRVCADRNLDRRKY